MSEEKKVQHPAGNDEIDDALDSALGIAFRSRQNRKSPTGEGPGTLVGCYKLLQQIGEGGFGVVYMAEQEEPIRRRVALKIIKLGMDTGLVVARFEAERQALAMMQHVNIASVLDAGATETGRPYFVMELIRGVPITEYCDRNKLPARERLHLFIDVCKAVQHAHQKGIIHRDLKPTNVMVTLRDGVPVPKVIDFGVAKATQARLTEKTIFTQYGQFIGTPAYMSPEQVEMSELDVDTRTDIYALGVLLYELLTGSTPIDQQRLRAARYSDMQRMICEAEPPKPSTRLSQSGEALASISAQRSTEPKKLGQLLRGDLDWIVMKALEKDRTRRYETANGLAMDVVRYLNDEPVEASPPSVVYQLRKFAHKHHGLIAACAAVVAVLFLSVVVSTWLMVRAKKAEAESRAIAEERDQEATRAIHERQRAIEAHAAAEKDRDRARRSLYATRMQLVQRAWEEADVERMAGLLNSLRPNAKEADLRCWDWYHFWHLCHFREWIGAETLHGYSGNVPAIAYSPDGRLLATAHSSGVINLRDTVTWQEIRSLRDYWATSLAFSPDGTSLALTGQDHELSFWIISSDKVITFPNETGLVVALAYGADENRLLTCDKDGVVKRWNVETGNTETVAAMGDLVSAAAFTRDGAKLAVGRSDGELRLLDIASGQEDQLIEQGSAITVLEFSEDGTLLTSSGLGSGLWLWDLSTMQSTRVLASHRAPTALALSPDGNLLAAALGYPEVRLWDIASQRELPSLRTASLLDSLAFSPDQKTLVSGSRDGAVKVWDPWESDGRSSLGELPSEITQVTFLPDRVVAVARGAAIGYDPRTGKELQRQRAPNPLAMSPNGKWLVAINSGGTLQLVETLTGKIKALAENDMDIRCARFSPDSQLLAAGGQIDGFVRLWDVDTGRWIRDVGGHLHWVNDLAFSGDGRLLVSSGFEGAQAWDLADFRSVGSFVMEDITHVAISPEDQTMAAGNSKGAVKVWQLQTGAELVELPAHRTVVQGLAFSPDGTTLATSAEGTVKLWDVASSEELATFKRDGGQGLAFSPNGKYLAAAHGRQLAIWEAASSKDLTASLPAAKPRNLAPRPGSADLTSPLHLRASPFEHPHHRVSHLSSHWVIRDAERDYSTPVVSRTSNEHLTELPIPGGILLPRRTYYWSVAYTTSNGRIGEFSKESSFTTGNFPLEFFPLDISPWFNSDIIANPGDMEDDALDMLDCRLIVDGFDGKRPDNLEAQGLPPDGMLGVHRLGVYSQKNSIHLGVKPRIPVRIELSMGKYSFLRFVVVGGHWFSVVPVVLEYSDGTTDRHFLTCNDWFSADPSPTSGSLVDGLSPEAVPIINGLDRMCGDVFHDANEAAVFEISLPADPNKTLVAITLDARRAIFIDDGHTRFNLLAITGVRDGR